VKLLLPVAGPGQPPQPNTKYLAANLIVGALAAAVGGYLTALIAGRAPLLHAVILAAGIFLLSAISAFQGARPGQPKWYPFVLMVLGPASALAGGWLRSLS
jgi:CHASE2 domain-containing sensor protein